MAKPYKYSANITTTKNPGRLFWGCSRWKMADYGYFEWIDDSGEAVKQIKDHFMGAREMAQELETQRQMISMLLAEGKDRNAEGKVGNMMKKTDGQKVNFLCLLCALLLGFDLRGL